MLVFYLSCHNEVDDRGKCVRLCGVKGMLLMSSVSALSTSTLQRSSRRWSMERAMADEVNVN